MWLPIIGQDWDMIGTYSWGSVVLAWMYHQLCDACRRYGGSANIGGCAYLVQLWMWECLPIGRPERYEYGVIYGTCNPSLIVNEWNFGCSYH
jgi:hypothetical protein